MRLFVALDCPGDVKAELSEVGRRLSVFGGLRLVGEENLHVTLKFLGVVDEAGLGSVKSALGDVDFREFKLEVKGLGVFPNPGNVKVVWAGVGLGFDECVRLHWAVDSALRTHGFRGGDRFHPHITVARVNGRLDSAVLRPFLAEYADYVFGVFNVDGFSLFESRLTPKGPVYSKIMDY